MSQVLNQKQPNPAFESTFERPLLLSGIPLLMPRPLTAVRNPETDEVIVTDGDDNVVQIIGPSE